MELCCHYIRISIFHLMNCENCNWQTVISHRIFSVLFYRRNTMPILDLRFSNKSLHQLPNPLTSGSFSENPHIHRKGFAFNPEI